MSILMVTGIEGAENCAATLANQLGQIVEVANNRRTAISQLRRKEYRVVLVDERMNEIDPSGVDALWEQSGLAIPLSINFALSGTARIAREIRAALNRREREQELARRAAAEAIESELKSTVSGLLLHSQLALSGQDGVPSAVADRLQVVVELASSLRERLSLPQQASAPTLVSSRG